ICGIHSCFVTAKDGNYRFMKMLKDILNYRHPLIPPAAGCGSST
ncbi:TPA: hypothetical protein ACWXAE_004887, partial [Klebsiella pneumoniae]